MAGKLAIEIEGLEEAERRIKSLLYALESEDVEKVLVEGARIIRDEAKRRAPRGPTGNLQRSLKAKKGKRYGKVFATAFAAVDYKVAPHANLVEFGGIAPRRPKKKKAMYDKRTGTFYGREVAPMPARPFFRPAVDASKERVKQTVEDGLRKLIEGAVEK